MKLETILIIGLIIVSTVVGAYFPVQKEKSLAGVTNYDSLTLSEDLVVDGGSATLTTSNTATSTLIVGCIQTYATSTATPVKIQPTSNIGTASTTGANGKYFVTAWQYGTCP